MKVVDIERQIINHPAYSYVQKKECTNIEKISNAPTILKKRTGYIYAPLLSKDFAEQVLGLNFRRHIIGKPLYPVLVEDKEKADDLIKNEILKIKKELNKLSDGYRTIIDSGITPDGFDDKLFHQTKDAVTSTSIHISTLRQIKTLCASNIKNLKEDEKLYIIGHGTYNHHELGATEDVNTETISARTLVDNLYKHNLSKRFKDLRINACYSADVETPRSSHADDLEKASHTEDKTSFCEKMSELLFYKGFHSTVVTGYHGRGRTIGSFIHKTRLIANDDIRSSLVKKSFNHRLTPF